ncbi:hypothetical protein [Streptomyces ossamyceticus]|uniref:hypothetical protein n=1 Tax=Streptomyces ossamyceticus TaxID=249581 RepID=UPI00342750E2
MIVVIAFPLLWLLVLPDAWWSWTLFAALLFLALSLCAVGLCQTFNPPEEPAPESGSVAGQD